MGCERRRGEHAHHVQFRSQGGDDAAYNLLWLCRICHDAAHGIRSFA
jgi:predicted restriction endonuclease